MANGGGSQQSCTVSDTVYPALLPLMRTPRLPAADWTDTPADINGLVRFSGKPNLVSARVPSRSVSALPAPNDLAVAVTATGSFDWHVVPQTGTSHIPRASLLLRCFPCFLTPRDSVYETRTVSGPGYCPDSNVRQKATILWTSWASIWFSWRTTRIGW